MRPQSTYILLVYVIIFRLEIDYTLFVFSNNN